MILGFLLLNWQLGKQHTNTTEANRRQGQDRLKLDIFKEITERIETTNVCVSELGIVPTGFVGELILRRKSGVESRFTEQLRGVPTKATESIIRLMATVENYKIVLPEVEVFIRALSESLRRSQVAFGDFVRVAAPLARQYTQPMVIENEDELSPLANTTMESSIILMGVIADLRVAAQNYLLGGLFPNERVPERAPLDIAQGHEAARRSTVYEAGCSGASLARSRPTDSRRRASIGS